MSARLPFFHKLRLFTFLLVIIKVLIVILSQVMLSSMAMNLERYATKFGHYLLAFPEFLKFGSRFSYIAEILCPVFLFIPFKNWIFRTFILICFIFFHLGTAVMMEVGFFPFVSITMWILLIPSQGFDYLKLLKNFTY